MDELEEFSPHINEEYCFRKIEDLGSQRGEEDEAWARHHGNLSLVLYRFLSVKHELVFCYHRGNKSFASILRYSKTDGSLLEGVRKNDFRVNKAMALYPMRFPSY
jgi:hypothetical protein